MKVTFSLLLPHELDQKQLYGFYQIWRAFSSDLTEDKSSMEWSLWWPSGIPKSLYCQRIKSK